MNGKITRRNYLRVDQDRDQGFAMVTVLGIGTIMTALMLASLGYALQTLPQSRRSQDWVRAKAAAQAGINDFISRMNLTDTYGSKPDCKNLAVPGPGVAGCSQPEPSWQNVATGLPEGGRFHYSYAPINPTEGINLKVTGEANGVYRTLNARVAQQASTDYLYFSDYELTDPEDFRVYPVGKRASAICGGGAGTNTKYWYQNVSGASAPLLPGAVGGRRSGCAEIAFRQGDIIDGPAHFNDSPGILGNRGQPRTTRVIFTDGYSVSDPNCKSNSPGFNPTDPPQGWCFRRYPYGILNPAYDFGDNLMPYWGESEGVSYKERQNLKDNSSEFLNYPGCQFFGDTRIKFRTDGTMDVWNSKTAAAGQSTLKAGSPAGTDCGNASQFGPVVGGYAPTAPVNIPVPTNLTIFVRNAPSTNPCRPGEVIDGTASGSNAGDVIPQGQGTDSTGVTDINFFNPGKLTKTATQTFEKAATAGTWTPRTRIPATVPSDLGDVGKLDCGLGNIYIEGAVNGRLTVAAENNVIITDNLSYAGVPAGSSAQDSEHLLGLTAVNSLQIYHPVRREFTDAATTVASSDSAIPCSDTKGGPPLAAPAGAASVTCTWTDERTFDVDLLGDPAHANLNHPGLKTSGQSLFVHAALQALQHSFMVQSPQHGAPLGRLGLRGSLAQRYRGSTLVSTGGIASGFIKDYRYDDRLKYDEPPYFPRFSESVWVIKTTGELKPEF